MEALIREIEGCRRCPLYKSRGKAVPGVGPLDAEVMLVGEAPGYWESVRGEPFVGAAGKFLDQLLQIAGLRRERVWIGNVLKCRPPFNRDPTDDEIEACSTHLEKQFRLIKPKFVTALGRIAARALLGRYVSMGREHGSLVDCTYAGQSFKLFLTYHPAAGIYSGETKLQLQADFKKLGQLVGRMT